MVTKATRLREALQVITDLGLPSQQQNERTALCLLALLNLSANKRWHEAEASLIGITPIMDWSRDHYGRAYAPNTRETFRRQSMHQMVAAGIALYNPDKPDRAVNSPYAVYQIEPSLLSVLRAYGTDKYRPFLAEWLANREVLIERYAKARAMRMIPVQVSARQEIKLSSGEHSQLIKNVIEDFAPRYVPTDG